jgi:hypothetical protein
LAGVGGTDDFGVVILLERADAYSVLALLTDVSPEWCSWVWGTIKILGGSISKVCGG